MKKSQNKPVWLSNMVLDSIFARDSEAGERHSKAWHLLLIGQMVWLAHGLIGPSGLQLVVSYLVQSRFYFMGDVGKE